MTRPASRIARAARQASRAPFVRRRGKSMTTSVPRLPERLEKSGAHRFALAALARPAYPAIINEASTVTYAQLLGASLAFARRLQGLGADRSSTVALNTGDMVTSIAV